MGEMRNTGNILIGNPEERDHSENMCVDARVILTLSKGCMV
jgi:hypothetical protein